MAIAFRCPECETDLDVEDARAGERGECPGCGAAIEIPACTSRTRAADADRQAECQRVIVTDIRMRFLSMVWFMVKWTLASLPAFCILTIIACIAAFILVKLLQ